jgi:hypothetical protein
MTTFSICDICDQPLDLCECLECENCGKKFNPEFAAIDKFCSEECENEHEQLIDEKIKLNSE